MAQLLGNKFCIESLRNDVTDIQGTVIDVFSRAGPAQFSSWKYPDRMSCDIDMTDLLETYDYSEDEEERQVAHIVLMEMVVDRLVLLLQAMSRYMDQICAMGNSGSSPQKSSNSSVGLVAKKYWNKMVQMYTLVHQLKSENKTKTRQIKDLENTVAKLTEELEAVSSENQSMHSMTTTFPAPLNHADSVLSGALSRASSYHISKDDCSKACQTYETAFMPCEACHFVQRALRDVGDNVTNLCQTQALPSSLAKHMATVAEVNWLSSNDVAQWTTEQKKDMARVNKHLENLMSTIDPLKTGIAAEQRAASEMKNKMAEVNKEIRLERETQAAQRKQFDTKLREVKREGQEGVDAVQRRNDELRKHKEELLGQVQQMKAETEEQEKLLKQLDEAKTKLEKDMAYKLENNETVRALEGEKAAMKTRLADVKGQLSSSAKELAREKAKNKSVNKHTETVQGKQNSLVRRLDELDQECEELRDSVGELEEEKEKLQEAIGKAEEEKKELEWNHKKDQELVKDLQREKAAVVKNYERAKSDLKAMEKKMTEAVEREKLMIEYPDLNGPVNPDYVGTGDIAKDMENQVKANSVRIQVLEDQNTKLRHTITKMVKAQGANAKPVNSMGDQPVPLWRQDDSTNNYNNSNAGYEDEPAALEDKYSSSPAYKGQCFTEKSKELPPRPPKKEKSPTGEKGAEFLVGRSTKEQTRPKSRPNSATRGQQGQGSASSINAYLQLKKSGLMKQTPSRPTSGSRVPPSGRSDNYQPQDVFMCGKCDKMYNNKQDLEIHKSYCFGGV